MSKLKLAPHSIRKILEGPRALKVIWDDGHTSTYHYIWLRDNSPQSRDANAQRFHDIHDIPESIHPWSVTLSGEGGIEILWAQAEHRSYYTPGWLRAHCYSNNVHTYHTLNHSGNRSISPEVWSGRVVNKASLSMPFDEVVNSPSGKRHSVESLKRLGVAILQGVGTDSHDIERAVKCFGIIPETNRSRIHGIESSNLKRDYVSPQRSHGISNRMAFRNPMPDLKVVHCLSTGVGGGECILVDGYFVSGLLRRKQPGMFSLLSSFPIPFLWVDSQHCFFMGRTVIDVNYRGETTSIHFSHRSTGPFYVTSEIMESYYRAYRTFADMLHDSNYQLQFILEPGEVLVLDNFRVLSDTRSFVSEENLRTQTCYASWQEG